MNQNLYFVFLAPGRSLGVAFHDLQALMNMAADMVKLAERFRGVMAQVRQSHGISNRS